MDNYKSFNIINKLKEINEPYISVTEMNNSKYVKDTLKFEDWDDYFLAKEENYKSNTYYHLDGEHSVQEEYSGVGKGYYLGKDKNALIRFYDLEQIGLKVNVHIMKPKWFNLMKQESFNKFREIFKENGINIINSAEVGGIFIKMGYDGIRYYDVMATGEEFVLFNLNLL